MSGRFQYTGQAWIPELNLYYYKARFYSPSLGRFMQTDPIGYKDQINLYEYVGDDPVDHADPSGLFGLFGGCPAGDVCTSTNPGASNSGGNAIRVADSGPYKGEKVDTRRLTPGTAPNADWNAQYWGGYYTIGANGHLAWHSLAVEAAFGMGKITLAVLGGEVFGAVGVAAKGAEGATDLVTVLHFTDEAGVRAIGSGSLRAGTFVTLPSEVAGMSSREVEAALEIQPGRGAYYTTVRTSASNLAKPFNGPVTSGGAVQYQLVGPVPAGPFVPTP